MREGFESGWDENFAVEVRKQKVQERAETTVEEGSNDQQYG